jgi:2-polyprenyl-3-methyl-5-hydroxy-6-metoxy-1,4-benzoquinol methylase
MTAAKLIPEAKMSAFEKETLRSQLDKYYQQVTDYTAFETVSNQAFCWEKIEDEIYRQRKDDGKPIRILEVGAGRSGFSMYLKSKSLRQKVHYTAQDVTKQNASWLESQADNVIYGDISVISESNCFDIIFSTYVFEHVTDPSGHLARLYTFLKHGGSLFIFCPRYDVPGYLCPSSRHLNFPKRLEFSIRWGWARLSAFLYQRPTFLIQTDLAAFYQPFFKDSDAVHWVSLLDLQLWARHHNLLFRSIRLVSLGETGVKNWIVKRWMTCAVQMQKN